MAYYNRDPKTGGYVEDKNGILPGVEWVDDYDNGFRAIMFMPNFAGMQSKRGIDFLYRIQIKPRGYAIWLHKSTGRVSITNDSLVRISDGVKVPKNVALYEDGDLRDGYAYHLDYIIDSVFKGMYEPMPIYDMVIEEIKIREGIKTKK